ncbi:hypothetical protein L618_007000000030 [Rhodococcus rhodochrous J45]|uniref:Secreted protein n=1 Tax=Rhodococcus rhodochrous J45 TaxID=935266 RepID=A0A562D8H7_RHORH|nr:hypothetical protein [Rhodococcus rhodochrous]TWH06026.1 hypothetical protein L618_007000000030 [Rhodococcus rhodochrous J45]
MKRFVAAAIASMASLLALPAVASADPAVLPPIVTLTSDNSSITATITNPNEPRVISGATLTCTLAIIGSPEGFSTSVLPFENPDPHGTPSDPTDATRYPQAGQTVTITRADLPQGQYRLVGQCGQMLYGGGWLWSADSASERVEYEIWVGPEPAPEPTPGLLGSLNFNR